MEKPKPFFRDSPAMARPEHPNPMFHRETWMSLNGPWHFAICPENQKHENLEDWKGWEGTIEVPFCLQAPLSGALEQLSNERKEKLGLQGPPLAPGLKKGKALWYFRKLQLPENWVISDTSHSLWLHIGACDSWSQVFVNGKGFEPHFGGNTAFSINISEAVRDHTVTIHIKCTDVTTLDKPCGKQLAKPGIYKGQGNVATLYSNVTGIWQTVWLELRPTTHISRIQIVPEVDEHGGNAGHGVWHVTVHAQVSQPDDIDPENTAELVATLFTNRSCEHVVTTETCEVSNLLHPSEFLTVRLAVPQDATELWSPEHPHLYGLQVLLRRGNQHNADVETDKVKSYAALRSFQISGDTFCVNGRPTFLRLVLDQGYYPDGLWTAPTLNALREDIVLAMRLGFNGARLHQKVFEAQYFALADELGFLVFCEYPDWNGGLSNRWEVSKQYQDYVKTEWERIVQQLHNHPSIMAWGLFNEFGPKNGWDRHHGPGGGFKNRYSAAECEAKIRKHSDFVRATVELVRNADAQKRPIHDSSGWIHVDTDFWSFHDYEQKVDRWAKVLQDPQKYLEGRTEYQGQPLLVAEYAGVGFDAGGPFGRNSDQFLPGYVQRGCPAPQTKDEALTRIAQLTKEIYRNGSIYSGYCITQLYDVEYEKNGLLKYDRTRKFSMRKLKRLFDGRLQTGRWRAKSDTVKLPIRWRCAIRPFTSRTGQRLRLFNRVKVQNAQKGADKALVAEGCLKWLSMSLLNGVLLVLI